MSVQQEQILVVPTERFREIGYFQGFCPDVQRYWQPLLGPHQTSYQLREQMERDPNFKQLIPYAIFRHLRADGEDELFCYRRGTGQGEERLHAKLSIGVGGHISAGDGETVAQAYQEGMRRELEEEVEIGAAYESRCVGLINDDETEVGRVHLGVVHVLDLKQPHVVPREPDLVAARFVPVSQLLQQRDQMESWSRICLDALFGGGDGAPGFHSD